MQAPSIAQACRAFLCASAIVWGTADGASGSQVRQGEYVFRAAGCATCHTDADNKGAFLAGGRALETSFGTFYSPNITPDPNYGIGGWSDADFVRALRHGVSPSGEHYYPAFPYTAYTRMTRDDMLALKAYLITVPPVARENRPHELAWYVRARSLLWLWKLLYFAPGEYQTDATRSQAWNRGAYLATALAHCAQCHTPRNLLGAPDNDRYYAGTTEGPEGVVVPNITPDRKTGIGRWDAEELAEYLRSGATPDGDFAGSLMADVIDDGLRYLDDADVQAIVDYVRSLTPIEHAIERKKTGGKKRDAFE